MYNVDAYNRLYMCIIIVTEAMNLRETKGGHGSVGRGKEGRMRYSTHV